MHLLSYVVLAGLIPASALPCASRACSCRRPPTAAEARDAAGAVFTARVVALRDSAVVVPGYDRPYRMRLATLRVERVWKGELPPEVVVRAGDGRECEYPFAAGEHYLVYAYATPDGLGASLCSRTRILSQAAGDLEALGPPVRAPGGRAAPRPSRPDA